MECSICNEAFPEDVVYHVKRVPDNGLVDHVEGVEHNGVVCQECYGAANICDGCSCRFVEDDDCRTDSDGGYWCHDCYDNHFSTCSYCEREVWMDDTFYDDGYVCDRCSDEHYFSCACCDEYTHHDDGNEAVDGTVCGECHSNRYTHCQCGDTVHDTDWCHSCGSCTACCTCAETGAEEEAVPEPCNPYPSYVGQSVPANGHDEVQEASIPSQYNNQNYNSPVSVSPPEPRIASIHSVGGASTGMPALIQTLDNSAFRLTDTNIEAVLGMLDKSKKLKVGDITGRHCTANDSYFQLSRLVAEIGKVKKPRYIYGVRSNEYDVILHTSQGQIASKLDSLGLTYKIVNSESTAKVGLSFRVRKRGYDTCITFLKFLCSR